jgi:hypothetical protein
MTFDLISKISDLTVATTIVVPDEYPAQTNFTWVWGLIFVSFDLPH